MNKRPKKSKLKAPMTLEFRFADESSEPRSLVETEKARLREMHRLLSSKDEMLRDFGEGRLIELAQRLARERDFDVRARKGNQRDEARDREVLVRTEKSRLTEITTRRQRRSGPHIHTSSGNARRGK